MMTHRETGGFKAPRCGTNPMQAVVEKHLAPKPSGSFAGRFFVRCGDREVARSAAGTTLAHRFFALRRVHVGCVSHRGTDFVAAASSLRQSHVGCVSHIVDFSLFLRRGHVGCVSHIAGSSGEGVLGRVEHTFVCHWSARYSSRKFASGSRSTASAKISPCSPRGCSRTSSTMGSFVRRPVRDGRRSCWTASSTGSCVRRSEHGGYRTRLVHVAYR
jgi:hypothetical protein